MVNGIAELEIKAAFHFYLKERLKLTRGHEKEPAKKQQIILTNEDEINTQIKLLKEIEKKGLESLEFVG